MKKIISFTILLAFVLLIAGEMVSVFKVNNTSEQFGKVLPKNTLIYDRDGKKFWVLTASAIATNTLTTATKQVADSAVVASLNSAIHDSLNQAQVNFAGDIKIKGNDLTFGNGASISNASADTARVTETAVKIEGKLVNFNDYVSHSIATNTILGITAGEKLTSGFSNTFTGEQAGKKVTTGYVNSIYGAEAGKSLTTGFHNNLVGYYAGARITTGKYNNFFGSETGSILTTGEHNTIMGHHAMLGTLGDAGTASYNTAIGANSCYKVATGVYNATLGFRAMGSGDGNYNTMLGSYTGHSNPGNIGDRNVFIGYRAGSECLTASDSLIIASDNAGTPKKQEIFKGSFADSSLIATGKFTIEGDKLAFGSGASITNPSSGILSLNSGIVSIPSDSTYAGQVLHADTTKTNVIIMPNGAVISNTHADTLKLTEANTIIDGNAKLNGFLTLTEGTSTTFTQDLNRLTIIGDSISIRAITNINPYRATSPQTTTVIGMGAGTTGMSGAHNVVMGYQAGSKLTTGNQNAFSGSSAGFSNTTGQQNTFNGSYAGFSNTTGQQNTFNGSYAGYQNTTGYYNAFSGSSAGRSNITGYQNTFIGTSAGRSNTTGYQNTFNGYASGRSNITGSTNLCIGDSTGTPYKTAGIAEYKAGAQPLKTTHRNVLIGHRASLIDSTTSDNFILQSDNGSNVQRLMQGSFADSSLTVNGIISYKKPFGKFYRIYTQTPANPDAWENIRWNEKHAETTSHFTATADSQGVIISKAGIYAVRCVSKMLWTGSAATTVSSYFRLWQGKGAAITKELRTSQHTSIKEKNTSNANDEFFWGSRYFAAGDTVYAQWRTSNVGNLIQGSAIFANPTSASIVIEYIKER